MYAVCVRVEIAVDSWPMALTVHLQPARKAVVVWHGRA